MEPRTLNQNTLMDGAMPNHQNPLPARKLQTRNFRPLARCRPNRSGATTVEFALVSTLLFVLFFAGLELCRVAMIRPTADNAVYEACRTGIVPGATSGEVRDQARAVMATLGISIFDLEVIPGTIDRDTDEITVRIDVPMDPNSYIPNGFTAGSRVVRELTLRREGIR